jgi:magnesium chelatase family protein
MLSRIAAAALVGIEAVPVIVEVDVSSGGLPGLTMVGLPDTTVRESRDRVRTAIRNAGFPFPTTRVTVSLAPADLRKIGAGFDLPIALGVLAASGAIPHRDGPPMVAGGGNPDGVCRRCRAVADAAARRMAPDCSSGGQPPKRPFSKACRCFRCGRWRKPHAYVSRIPARLPSGRFDTRSTHPRDLSEVRGQALGGGPSKSRRPARITCCQRPAWRARRRWRDGCRACCRPDVRRSAGVTTIHSVAGTLPAGLIARPFRAPHHTCSKSR